MHQSIRITCLLELDGIINKNHGRILLNNRSGRTEGAIQLHSRKDEVQKVNEVRIEALPTPAIKLMCFDNFNYKFRHRKANPELEGMSEMFKDYEESREGKEDGTLKALVSLLERGLVELGS
jgi:hypothetical protein